MEKVDDDPIAALYGRPGFLLRRANQIAAALFLEAVAGYDITTTQYGALVVIGARGLIDQIGLARMLGLDRSTAGLVIANLERRGTIERTSDPEDKRRRVLTLAPAGKKLLEDIATAAARVSERELAIFSQREAQEFVRLLTKFVTTFNTTVRTPLLGD
ncbi:MarR family winged helix-turn-helix transcriptional regulator [Sphingomonas sp. MMS24-J13]|uniref:MarR family winged helix-turn-helix transcriptional regulator n=1 Tax=Sphingomonas sp. MMS24-J13 TaxID=3238686 RepID=UPI003850BE93